MSSLSWNDWLEEPLEVETGYFMPRWRIIHRFVKDGLVPFLQRYGYTMHGSISSIQSALASGLYTNQNAALTSSDWTTIPYRNTEDSDEDRAHFDHILSQETWDDEFWSAWNWWPDVGEEEWRGWDRRQDIQNFAWSQMNLAASAQTTIVDEHIFGVEEYFEDADANRRSRSTKDDTYLREAAESNEWGGYRR